MRIDVVIPLRNGVRLRHGAEWANHRKGFWLSYYLLLDASGLAAPPEASMVMNPHSPAAPSDSFMPYFLALIAGAFGFRLWLGMGAQWAGGLVVWWWVWVRFLLGEENGAQWPLPARALEGLQPIDVLLMDSDDDHEEQRRANSKQIRFQD